MRDELEELQSAKLKIEGRMKSLHQEASDVMSSLLSPYLAKQWDNIVEKECNGTDFVSLSERAVTQARGRYLGSLSLCYLPFVGLSAPSNCADEMFSTS